MNDMEPLELNNYDFEDISDVLVKVGNSFQLDLKTDIFKDATTFGDICDIISRELSVEHSDDCTTQQAFYKLRQSIFSIQPTEKNTITRDSDLEELFPKKHRRRKMLQIEKHLGFRLKILEPKSWISTTLLFIFLASLIVLFINWKFGLAGIALSIIGSWIASKLGKEFNIKNLGEVAEKIARENYIKSRRNPKTVNRQEISAQIKELFIHDLHLDHSILTKEAPLF